MTLSSEIETARLIMMQARKTLEDYEAQGTRNPKVYGILLSAFKKASTKYLRLSAPTP